MAAIPTPEHSTVTAIYRAYEDREAQSGGHRPHLGASLIGHPCERHLWLTFRWALRPSFGGRLLRLFDTGQRAEVRFVSDLRAIGVTVHDTDEHGQQWRVSAVGGHFGGSLDGAALGVPEAPATWHVVEFKTHNAKSFKDLQAKGVQASKPMHHAQMQTYMGLTGMTRALYLAENKDTSELHAERVRFDATEFARIMARAESVVTADEPPARLSSDPAWFECKWCHHHPLCHGQRAPEVSCRTCAHSTPDATGVDARWVCELRGVDLTVPQQRAACPGHRYIPILLAGIAAQVDARDEPDGNACVTYRLADGREIINGAGHPSSAIYEEFSTC